MFLLLRLVFEIVFFNFGLNNGNENENDIVRGLVQTCAHALKSARQKIEVSSLSEENVDRKESDFTGHFCVDLKRAEFRPFILFFIFPFKFVHNHKSCPNSAITLLSL